MADDDQQLQDLRDITERKDWRAIVMRSVKDRRPPFAAAVFDTYWIEGGHRIREQVGDDHALAAFLRLSLTPYRHKAGEPVELFRGENIDRLRAGRIGFAWTPSRATAEMFASGLNAVGRGGVLLRAWFGVEVIAGPCGHSLYLGEDQYTVDPTPQFEYEVLGEYPPFG